MKEVLEMTVCILQWCMVSAGAASGLVMLYVVLRVERCNPQTAEDVTNAFMHAVGVVKQYRRSLQLVDDAQRRADMTMEMCIQLERELAAEKQRTVRYVALYEAEALRNADLQASSKPTLLVVRHLNNPNQG